MPPSAKSVTRLMFLADFAIFCPPIWTKPPCTQIDTTPCPPAPSDWAISSSWCGNLLSLPPVWMSKRSPRCFMDIAEHSICQPGYPSPQGLGHFNSRLAPALFHSAKSAGCRLFRSEEHTSELQSL